MNHDRYDIPEADYHHSLDELLYQSEEAFSLDKYQETGVYVEEEKENG
ncbi:hypothetical protein CP8484711_2181A, partial [Chlamydia psittaci 84-8471/1]